MNRKGFTLIELLVVVAVLALLASIVFSNLGGAREGARISNTLSFQSQTHSLLGSDLVGWWNFDGEDARDISGYRNNGTVTGATFVDGVSGTRGKALDFTASHYVRIAPSNSIITDNNSWTLSAWFNASSIGSGVEANRILTFHRSDSPNWSTGISLLLGENNRAKVMYRKIGSHLYLPSHENIEVDTWYNFTVTYNGVEYRSYINGEDEKSQNDTFEGFGSTDAIIGAFSNSGYFFRGRIDDVRVYSRPLNASEVSMMYAQEKDRYLADK